MSVPTTVTPKRHNIRITWTSPTKDLPDKLFYINVVNPDYVGVVARASADTVSGGAPLTVNFDASASSDKDYTITSYAWDFGEGSSGSGVTASHTYTAPGIYTAILTALSLSTTVSGC